MRTLLLLTLLLIPLACLAEVRIIEVKHRPASDIENQVRALLDDDEKVTAAGGHLVLVAAGESLLAAEKLIGLLDVPQRNLLIRVRQIEELQQVGKDASAKVRYGNRTGDMSAGSIGYRKGNSASIQEQQLQLLEGGKGLIEIGQEIPFTEQWSAVTGEMTGYAEKIAYKTIATGFWISPQKIIDNKVLVDVEPYISDAEGRLAGKPPRINYSQLRSRLQVPLGQWYPLGSQMQQRDKVSRAIVSWRSNNRQAEREIQIRIETSE